MNAKQIIEQAEAIIFDLDGVLVDTAVFHYEAWRRLAQEFGYDFTVEANEQLKGVSRVDSLRLILHAANHTTTVAEEAELADKKNRWYLELVNNMKEGDVLPGTIDFLKNLKAKGKKIALGSASKNARTILDKTGITDYFDAVIDGNAVKNSKPHPEVFLRGAEALGVAPANCVVFEDAQAGIKAAKAAGMRVIGVDPSNTLQDYDDHIHDLTAVADF